MCFFYLMMNDKNFINIIEELLKKLKIDIRLSRFINSDNIFMNRY